jgi:hypothetical protein
MVALFMLMLTTTWLLSTFVRTIQINDNGKCKLIAGDFENYADAVIQSRADCPTEHIQSFT